MLVQDGSATHVPAMPGVRVSVLAAACSLLTLSNAAQAEVPRWQSKWPTFRAAEVAFTVGTGLQAGYLAFFSNPATRNLEGGILFDDWARSGLRAHSVAGRKLAADVSDYMYYALIAYPMVDAPLVGGIRGGGKVAVQTLAINVEGIAIAGAYAMMFEKVGRARPSARECDADQGYDARCGDVSRLNESNVSGHTAIAFAGASLTCAHHLHLPLYGGGAPDVATCIGAMMVASTQGVLRVVSDNHYATDVLLGSAVGFTAGYIVPWLLHYRGGAQSRSSALRYVMPSFHSRDLAVAGSVAPAVGPSMLGLTMQGTLGVD